MSAVKWSELGFVGLIPVVPPGAKISANSTLSPASAGKAPGVKRNGEWSGANDWQKKNYPPENIDHMGGSIGLRTEFHPCLDIDSPNPLLVGILVDTAERYLEAILPFYRVGGAPKRAYLFNLAGEPFGRMRREWEFLGEKSLVEILAAGNQVVIEGMHRSGKPYTWSEIPRADQLLTLTREQAEGLLDAMAEEMEGFGCEVKAFGTGDTAKRAHVDQARLAGPLDKVTAALRTIPNTVETYPDRDDYVAFGYALKAALPDNPEEAYALYEEWSLGWPGSTAEVISDDWQRMNGPFEIGADFIYREARRFGWSDAAEEFSPVTHATPKQEELEFSQLSDMWMAQEFIREFGDRVRFEQDSKRWYCYEDGIWSSDQAGATRLAMRTCARIAGEVSRRGATDKEKAAADAKAKSLCSRKMLTDLMSVAAADERMKVSGADFDANPDLLGVPGGVVDLRTGDWLPADPALMISRRTSIAPEPTPTPAWDAFLLQATGGHPDYVRYLERAAGYTLTGHTREHKFFYLYGNGGTGKSTFLDVLYSVMGGFSHAADSGLFLDTKQREHTQELAATQGRRMVAVNEIKKGRQWNEAKLKSLTGGDIVNARHMYGSDFNFRLFAKFWMAANNRPVFTGIDAGISRRVQILPFVCKPESIDRLLGEKLRAEYPGILHRLVRAARDWYEEGLVESAEVTEETEEYVQHEDLVAQWEAECCEPAIDPSEWSKSSDLWDSWNAWSIRNGRKPVTTQGFATILKDHSKRRVRRNEGSYWEGLRLAGAKEFEVVQ
jgi:putative DNA primase/helicase